MEQLILSALVSAAVSFMILNSKRVREMYSGGAVSKIDIKDKTIKMVEELMKREAEAAKEAVAKEQGQVPIDPECFVAREIRYQTAILKDIQHQLEKKKG